MLRLLLTPVVLIALWLATGCSRPVADQDPPGDTDWPLHGLTHQEQRFSALDTINEDTVARLGLVWSLELGTLRGLEATPLVIDGVIYTSGAWSVVYAIDARSGRLLWTHDPQVSRKRARVLCCDAVNRGVAFARDKVFVGALDGRLIALDAATGAPVWEVATFDRVRGYSITGAPRIAGDRVIIGNGGAEMGVRGYVSAYHVDSGEFLWRSYTVPGNPADGFESEAMEQAAATWNGEWWHGGGGGTAWDSMVYDPDLELVYIGTGNGAPWYRNLRSPGGGDNLYLSSILAVRADSGEPVWHFQTTPGDHWDFTATQPLMLAELTIAGELRSVIMQAPKNGFFYVLDRRTGEFLSGAAFAQMNWASGLDQDGRPIEVPGAAGPGPSLITPDPTGAHNWYPMAYSPDTGLVYLPVRDGTFFLHRPKANWQPDDSLRNSGIDSRYEGPLIEEWFSRPMPVGQLVAWDPVRQQARWRVDSPVLETGGVLATAGNLVFQGRSDGVFAAYRATDGERLWQFDAGTGIMAAPVTYRLDGVQYMTLMVGWGGGMGLINPPILGPTRPGYGRILTFALDASAPFDPPEFGRADQPVPARPAEAPEAIVKEGQALYDDHCFGCHGVMAVAGPLPDLRYATEETHSQFQDIVRGGLREAMGMPRFDDVLSEADVEAIRAYVLFRAHATASR